MRFVQTAASMHANFETNDNQEKLLKRRNGPPEKSFPSRSHLSRLLLFPDLLILYAAFAGALRIHQGAWALPHEAGLGRPLLVTMAVYVSEYSLFQLEQALQRNPRSYSPAHSER